MDMRAGEVRRVVRDKKCSGVWHSYEEGLVVAVLQNGCLIIMHDRT